MKTAIITHALDGMDIDLIAEHMKKREELSAAASAKPRRVRRVALVAAAAAAAVLLTAGAVGFVIAQTPHETVSELTDDPVETSFFTVPDDAVLPPVRVSEMQAQVSLAKSYDLATAYENADLVAQVRVLNWREETEHSTYYDAEVIKSIKEGIKEKKSF